MINISSDFITVSNIISKLLTLNLECLSLYFIMLLCAYLASSDNGSKQDTVKCPLWHIPGQTAQCKCGDSYNGIVSCIGDFLYIKQGNCMTWNNYSKQAELQSCLFGQ